MLSLPVFPDHLPTGDLRVSSFHSKQAQDSLRTLGRSPGGGRGGAGRARVAGPASRLGPVSPPSTDARTPCLEPDTMHARLRLSADLLTVRCGLLGRLGPAALRFDAVAGAEPRLLRRRPPLLGSGCAGGGRRLVVGAAYGTLRRHGASDAARLGCNRQSWCLKRYDLEYWAFHDCQRSRLRPADPDRLGVFLDYEAGVLAFDVTDGMSHLHTFRAAFQAALPGPAALGRGSHQHLPAALVAETLK